VNQLFAATTLDNVHGHGNVQQQEQKTKPQIDQPKMPASCVGCRILREENPENELCTKKYGASASQELGMLVFVSLLEEAFKHSKTCGVDGAIVLYFCTVELYFQ
jgi:hypothetical protein